MLRNNRKNKFSFGEKIKFFSNKTKSKRTKKKTKIFANKKLHEISRLKKNIKIGDIFVVDDVIFGNSHSKARAVVVVKTTKNTVKVAPLYKTRKILPVSQFDGDRLIDLSRNRIINKNNLYLKKGFKFKKSYLTTKEKNKLYSKINQYNL